MAETKKAANVERFIRKEGIKLSEYEGDDRISALEVTMLYDESGNAKEIAIEETENVVFSYIEISIDMWGRLIKAIDSLQD